MSFRIENGRLQTTSFARYTEPSAHSTLALVASQDIAVTALPYSTGDDSAAAIASSVGGVPLAKQLLERHPALKVLFHSGYSADSIDLPGTRFLQKPFAEDDLLHVLRELLDA